MAQDNSVGGLYIRLGLSLSELETGFITASQTVAANISRLNREADLIRLRAEVEIAGLDEVNDAERILQIRTESLNQRIAIQRDRIRLLSAAYRDVARTQGETSVAAQRAAIRLERERLALANLERDLRSLSETQDETNGVLGELSNMLPAIPTKLQAVGAAAGAVAAGVGAAGAATKELIEEFRELQRQSYELNMPFADTREFLREMKLAGGDIGDIEGYIRGITDAWVKGEYDDPEFIALRKYGAQITDATGRLKDFKSIADEVYQAFKQADAAGEGIEFLQLTGGEMGIRDIIQYFQRLEEAKEDAAKIFNAKIDDKELHELDRTLNKVEMQSQELKAALGDIFVPAVQSAAEKFFDTLHDATEFLVENKDTFQRWGFIAAETFDTAAEKAGGFVDKLAEIAKTPKGTTGDAKTDKIMADMGWRYQEFKPQTPWGVNTDWDNFNKASKSYGIFDGIIDRATEKHKAYNEELEKTSEKLDELDKKTDKNPLNQYDFKRIQAFKDELEDLKIELDFGDNDYQRGLAELDLWKRREIDYKNFVSDEERAAIEALAAVKKELLDKAHAEEIQQYWQNATDIQYELTHTAFEKQLRDIELWKEAELEKAATAEDTAAIIANAAAKEAQAFENAVDRIKGKLQSLDDKVFEIDHSQYENDLRRIQQEYFRTAKDLQNEGIFTPEVKAQLDYLYTRQKQNLDRRADESREKGSDYTKTPEGTLQRGGNNIVVIGADQIIDDGLKRANIGVMVDENRIRAQVSQGLSQQAKDLINATQATRDLTDAQKQLVQQASGFQLIEGDTVANEPQIQQINGDQLQEFGGTLQQINAELEQVNPAQKIAQAESALAETLNQAATDFPADYFKTLADNMKGVSDVMVSFTNDLIDAHGRLKDALSNMPQGNGQMQTGGLQQLPTDSFQRLSTSTQDLSQTQDLLARRTRELETLPTPKRDSGFEFGFDHDLFGTLATTSTSLIGLLQAAGAIAPHPAIKIGALALGGALGAAAGKGTFDATNERPDERLKPYIETDLSGLIEPLTAIDQKFDSLLQRLQAETADDSFAYLGDILSEKLGALPNIERYAQEISQAVQTIELPTETIVTPLNNINGIVAQILSALQNRQPPSITVSPNIDVNLGGAYVFDDALKKALVGDITSDVVTSIKDAVQQATSKSSYGYGA